MLTSPLSQEIKRVSIFREIVSVLPRYSRWLWLCIVSIRDCANMSSCQIYPGKKPRSCQDIWHQATDESHKMKLPSCHSKRQLRRNHVLAKGIDCNSFLEIFRCFSHSSVIISSYFLAFVYFFLDDFIWFRIIFVLYFYEMIYTVILGG